MKRFLFLVLFVASLHCAFAVCNEQVVGLSIATTTAPALGVNLSWQQSTVAGATYDVAVARFSNNGTVLGRDTVFYLTTNYHFYAASASYRYTYSVRVNCDSTDHGAWSNPIELSCTEQVSGLVATHTNNPRPGIILSWTPSSMTGISYQVQMQRSYAEMFSTTSPSYFFPYDEYYCGTYLFNVRLICPNGSAAPWSNTYTRTIANENCMVELPDACPGLSLDAKISVTGTLPELLVGCENDKYVLKPTFTVNGGTIVDYKVDSIPYNPPYPLTTGNQIFVDDDDIFSDIINLPFPFCFYENTYNKVTIGANGLISFIPSTGQSGYALNNINIPDPTMDPRWRNAIYGVMEDGDPRETKPGKQNNDGAIRWALLGEAPCRVLSVSWYNIPLFSSSCNTLWNSYQIVMYEGSNIIDVYVNRRNRCTAWNGGRGVIGVQNATATKATAAPGRNLTNSWSTIIHGKNAPEAWRFTPTIATSNHTITWYKGNHITGALPASDIIGYGDSLTLIPRPNMNDTVTCRLQVASCNGTNFDFRDHAVVVWGREDIQIEDSICQNNEYIGHGFVVPRDSLIYPRVYKESKLISNTEGCDTTLHLTLNVKPNFHVDVRDTVCPDSIYMLGNTEITKPGFYTDTLQSISGCDSVVILFLSHKPTTSPLFSSISDMICVGDVSFDLQFAPSGSPGELPPSNYKVVFDDKLIAMGFENQSGGMNIGDGYLVRVNIPSNVYPNNYKCTVFISDSIGCASSPFDIIFQVKYPSSVMEQKWDNVIALKNQFYNGGYGDFESYKWFLNGQLLPEQTNSFIYLGEDALKPSDEYVVEITRTDGSIISTCPFNPSAPRPTLSPYPIVDTSGGVITVTFKTNAPVKANLRLLTTTGIVLNSVSFNGLSHTIGAPTDGTYLIDIRTDNGSSTVLPIVIKR